MTREDVLILHSVGLPTVLAVLMSTATATQPASQSGGDDEVLSCPASVNMQPAELQHLQISFSCCLSYLWFRQGEWGNMIAGSPPLDTISPS